MVNSRMKFYNVRAKHSVTTDKYKQMTSNGRKFAVAIASDGTKMYRIMPKAK